MWTGVTPQIPSYGLTKNSGTALIQQIAKDVRPDELQIVSIHPGSVLSDTARAAGLDESSLAWDDGELLLSYRRETWCSPNLLSDGIH